MWKKELPSLGVENVVESLLELDTDFLFVYGTLRRGFALHHHLRRMGVERDGFVALLETAGGKVQPFGQVGYHVREGRKQKGESSNRQAESDSTRTQLQAQRRSWQRRFSSS